MVKKVKLKDYPGYSIDELGTVYNDMSQKIRSVSITPKGYANLRLKSPDGKRKHMRVHRLVAMAFIPNPHNLPQVNHKDGNKLNNRVDNLEWCDQYHNMQHAYKTGLNQGRVGFVAVTKKEIRSIIKLHRLGKSHRFIASLFNVSSATICRVINKKK